jgi:small subunit ribosomal protein S6
MSLYELVCILRQDLSSSGVDNVLNDLVAITKDNGGKILKTEYWGLRNLAYEIRNNKKGHYILLGLEADHATTLELDRKIKLNENIIRSSLIRVDEIIQSASPILKSSSGKSHEDIIDVTV